MTKLSMVMIQPGEWEKIFSIFSSDRVLIFTRYENSTNNIKTNNPIKISKSSE
jgi:hypothetical protein